MSQRLTDSSAEKLAYSGDCDKSTKDTVIDTVGELISFAAAYAATAESSPLCVILLSPPEKSDEKSRISVFALMPLELVTAL